MIVLKVLLSNFFIIITREMSNFIMKGHDYHRQKGDSHEQT